MIAHLLGNGPSRSQFSLGVEPKGDLFGCNLSDFSLPLVATFIMDLVVVNNISNNGIALPWPAVVPQALVRTAQRCEPPIKIHSTVAMTVRNGQSTGHKAAVWLLENGYKEIHFWGFDSMFANTVTSDTHQKIPEGISTIKNVPRWRANWDLIKSHKLAKEATLVFHAPIAQPDRAPASEA